MIFFKVLPTALADPGYTPTPTGVSRIVGPARAQGFVAWISVQIVHTSNDRLQRCFIRCDLVVAVFGALLLGCDALIASGPQAEECVALDSEPRCSPSAFLSSLGENQRWRQAIYLLDQLILQRIIGYVDITFFFSYLISNCGFYQERLFRRGERFARSQPLNNRLQLLPFCLDQVVCVQNQWSQKPKENPLFGLHRDFF